MSRRRETKDHRKARIRREMRAREARREAWLRFEMGRDLRDPIGTVLDAAGDVVLFAYDGWWTPGMWVCSLGAEVRFRRGDAVIGWGSLWSVDPSTRQCSFALSSDLRRIAAGDTAHVG